MNKPVILSGYDLVAKGITKSQATLPELGLKDVIPNGSWLESKQIQSAIDARKQLIAAERIEKSGILNHAEWKENLMLAEVVQKSGGHWQFLGHNIGKTLYLFPEEALFLIEINSLLLKHNDVKVSLQQAYSLLLRDKKSLIQYKVYGTLSRCGYKVFRHTDIKVTDKNNSDAINETNKSDGSVSQVLTKQIDTEITERSKESMTLDNNDEENCNLKRNSSLLDISDDCETNEIDETIKYKNRKSKNQTSSYSYKIEKYKNRQLTPCNVNDLHKLFDDLPSFLNTELVTIKAPDKRFIPDNISLSKTIYTLNLNSLRTKQFPAPSPQVSQTSSSIDEVNRDHFRRIQANFRYQVPPHIHFYNNTPYRHSNCWLSYLRANYYHMAFQRPYMGNFLFTPRFQYIPRFQTFPRSQNYPRFQNIPRFQNFPRFQNTNRPRNFSRPYTNRRQRKRQRSNTKLFHFETINKLAAKIKNLVATGQMFKQPLNVINNLIQRYNLHYGSKIKLTGDYEIIEDANILDTIELDDEGEQIKKKPRLDSNSDTYTINFKNIQQLAERLKVLDNDHKSSARHRRAFSNLIKTFNKSYSADIYVTNNFKVLDRRFINIESSSDSDCMIDENAKSSGKKVRNPFNILKRLSEKRNKSLDAPGTSTDTYVTEADMDDNRDIQKNLSKEWIPDDDNFGRPEISDADDSYTSNLFYDFMEIHQENYENWLDLKISFLSNLEETADFFGEHTDVCVQNRSLVAPEDCVDIVSVLKKLSIIKSHDMIGETKLTIDFDVYNRDVQNFKKTKPPVPHFRVSCLDESAKFPSGEEIASLHAKYKDDVRIVFAIVGNGTINFVQINPFSLPNHISSNVT